MNKTILVHICCSVDSHYFLGQLQLMYPEKQFIGYFYNPNIHPRQEYDLRYCDVQRSCQMLGIPLIEGEYEYQEWFESVKGLEEIPEKGERCIKCFDIRLESAAKVAHKMCIPSFTTTLLSSPLKDSKILYEKGDQIAKKYDLDFLKVDMKSNGGTQRQNELANKDKLYKQNYCGCTFALNKQRDSQNQLILEMISNIGKQIMPGSNEQRMAVFQKRNECEAKGIKYVLNKCSKIVWRNFRSYCIDNHQVIDSYVIAFSKNKRLVKTGYIVCMERNLHLDFEDIKINIGYASKDDSVFLSLSDANKILKTSYRSVREMVFNPPEYEKELILRSLICSTDSINPIIIIDKIVLYSLKVFIDARFQETSVFNITTDS